MISTVSRRAFIHIAAAAVPACHIARLFGGGAGKKNAWIPIGVQLYGVRDACQSDLTGTLKKLAEMGYEGVEFADYFSRSASELRNLLDDFGLKCCGTHIYLETLIETLLKGSEEIVEFNKTLDNPYLIVRWLDEKRYTTKEKWIETADLFNLIAERLQPHGMRIGYHNHGFEFRSIDGEIPWNIFADNTRQEVILQLDTGNCAAAGADALYYIKRNPGRTVTCHVKPYSENHETALLGEDDIDWKEVFHTCESTGGTEWYIIEYEAEGVPPLWAMKTSLENMREILR
jgi:sugar phosphate isomerase/epimerase